MKKMRSVTLLIMVFLLSSLLLSGCKGSISTEISDKNEDISVILPPTDEPTFPPLSDEPSGGSSEEEDVQTSAPSTEKAAENAPKEEEKAAILSEYDTYTAVCAAANVNVRSGPGTSDGILFTLRKGDSLPYLERKGEWLKVQTEGGVGYLYAKYAYLAETSLATERVIRAGLDKLGTPYKWGAPRILTGEGTPSPYFTGNSFDCSSFVQYCYYVGCGIKLGNYTGSQADYTVGKKITSYAALRRGDFYFTGVGSISHVVIYLGGGYLLQTYSANGGPVSVTTDARWKDKFLSGRRPDLTVIEQFR